ncbi:MAG TPA: hypothetical protein EYP68_08140 [Candidatus Korarchaeota archaeon]|nr:hypothetical protein [Candidatus Korarchaeota archaeon]
MIQTFALIVSILAGIATILNFIFGIARRVGRPWLGWVLFGITLGAFAFIGYFRCAPSPKPELTISPQVSITEHPSITIDKIERNNRIWGHVEGINRDEYDNYKVLVYVHTDKWYIHPYQGQGEDLSWAKIKDDGTWSIETVKRKFTANAVAALVVKGNHPELTPIEDLEEIHYIAKIVIKGTGDL